MNKRGHKVILVTKRENGDLAVKFANGKTAIFKAEDTMFQAYAIYAMLQG